MHVHVCQHIFCTTRFFNFVGTVVTNKILVVGWHCKSVFVYNFRSKAPVSVGTKTYFKFDVICIYLFEMNINIIFVGLRPCILTEPTLNLPCALFKVPVVIRSEWSVIVNAALNIMIE